MVRNFNNKPLINTQVLELSDVVMSSNALEFIQDVYGLVTALLISTS